MLPAVPMTSASVLVALAMIFGVPKKISTGKVTSVPPPATALIAPAAAPAAASPSISAGCITGIFPRAEDGESGDAQARLTMNTIRIAMHKKYRAPWRRHSCLRVRHTD